MLAASVYLGLIFSYHGSFTQEHNDKLPLAEFVWFEAPNMKTLPKYQPEEPDLEYNFTLIEWKGGNCERERFVCSQKLEDFVWFETPDVKIYQPKDYVEDGISSEARRTKTEENLRKIEDQKSAEYLKLHIMSKATNLKWMLRM